MPISNNGVKSDQTRKRSSDPKSKTMDAEARRIELQEFKKKQVAAQRRAVQIVEQMLDNPVSQEWLLSVCHYICKSDYDDAVVERTYTKQCGYPLCGNELLKISSQKYHICTRSYKVYDISERKYFCSNKCYKASCFLKAQIPTSPLWLRDVEDKEAPITLLPLDNEKGSPGEEVDLGILKYSDEVLASGYVDKKKDKRIEATQNNIKMIDKNDNLEDPALEGNSIEETERNINQNSNLRSSQQSEANVPATEKDDEPLSEHIGQKDSERINTQAEKYSSLIESVEQESKCMNSQQKGVNIHGAENDNEPLSENRAQQGAEELNTRSEIYPNKYIAEQASKCSGHKLQRHPISKHPVDVAVTALREWVTPDTLKELSGNERFEDFLKEILDSGQMDIVRNFHIDQRKIEKMKVDYMKLCRKLDTEEAAEEELDAALIAETAEECGEDIKPHCDAESLDETCIEKKLSSYLQGKLTLSEIKIKEKKTSKKTSIKTVKKNTSLTKSPSCHKIRQPKVVHEKSFKSSRDVSLPIIDAYAQDALRRQVVLDRMKVIYPDILAPFGLTFKDISNDLLELIATFRLTSSTVTFKPVEWMLLAVFLLKILGYKLKILKEVLLTESSSIFLEKLLQKVQISPLQFDSLLCSVLNPHAVLQRAVCT